MALLFKVLTLLFLPMILCQQRSYESDPQQQLEQHDYLDIKSPEFFSFTPSPLRQPDSLRNRGYFDFLSTLYRHDQTKNSLFSGYPRDRRAAAVARHRRDVNSQLGLEIAQDQSLVSSPKHKRAIIFRPLFVYREQQVQKQRIADSRRRY